MARAIRSPPAMAHAARGVRKAVVRVDRGYAATLVVAALKRTALGPD